MRHNLAVMITNALKTRGSGKQCFALFTFKLRKIASKKVNKNALFERTCLFRQVAERFSAAESGQNRENRAAIVAIVAVVFRRLRRQTT